MNPSRHERLRSLFDRALEIDAAERGAWLEEACGDDASLLDELRGMLRAEAEAGGFLEGSAVEEASVSDWTGRRLSGYRILGLLAEGGMGVVYHAEQEQPRREVAIKLIRSGFPSAEALRRFALEAEVLGRLDHPGIARIFEAGTVEDRGADHPFFAMELIDGVPLTRFAEEAGLSLRDRCRLLIRVCEAVHHAHQKGVIHRDLKPANVLVRTDGQPKVLDFGVARVTADDLQATMRTDAGQVVGTIAYMSPEQVSGRPADLDTRTDVYALGVVGCELLAGRSPLNLRGKTLVEAARIIEEQDPDTSNTKGRRLPSDLDTILRACLAKERDRRYGSAAELAADFRRFLDDEPIAARPSSTAYQISKFARRNRGLVAGLAVAFVVLVAGIAVSVAGWSRASDARARAEAEEIKARTINEFLSDMLLAADPWADGREVKVVELLEKAGTRIDSTFADLPEAAIAAHTNLGTTYSGLAIYEEVEKHYRRALEIGQETVKDPADPRLIVPLRNLGQFLVEDGRIAEAESVEVALLPLLENGRADSLALANAWHFQGLLREAEGEPEEAAKGFRRSLAVSGRHLGPEHMETVTTRASLGLIQMQLDQLTEAKQNLEFAYRIRSRDLGPDHPATLITLNNLAFVYQRLGDHERALDMFARSLESRIRVHGERSFSAITGHHNLALQLGGMERAPEAIPHHLRAIALSEELAGPDHVRTHIATAAYGGTLHRLGRDTEAVEVLHAAYQGLSGTLGAAHWRCTKLAAEIAVIHEGRGETEKARRYRALAESF